MADVLTVADLEAALGMPKGDVRSALRRIGAEKNGRTYSWSSKTEFNDVVKAIKSLKKDGAKETKTVAPKETKTNKTAEPKSEKKSKKKAEK